MSEYFRDNFHQKEKATPSAAKPGGMFKNLLFTAEGKVVLKKNAAVCVITADGLSKVTFPGGLRTVKKVLAATLSGKYLRQFARISKERLKHTRTSFPLCSCNIRQHLGCRKGASSVFMPKTF